MNTSRKNAKWAGVFYIMATVAPILAYFFIWDFGGIVAGEPILDYLVDVTANEGQVIIGMFIELTWALAVIGIIVMLYPILKKHNETIALGFFSLRFIEAISAIIHVIIGLSLLTLSQEYAAAGMPGDSYFQIAGTLFLAARDWTYLIGSGLVWSLSALILNYLLYQKELIPRWLSIWGFVGATLSLINYLPQFFGIPSQEVLFIPIGLQEMVFAIWLITKGFNSIASTSESTSTEISR